ncbi:MAG: alpha-L-fucosidase [Chloroflexota bacterium]
MKLRYLLFLFAILGLAVSCQDDTGKPEDSDFLKESRSDFLKRTDWFRKDKIGVIIHWGPASLTGKEMSWCRKGPRPGYPPPDPDGIAAEGDVPVEIYDNLYKEFNPTAYNPDEWIKVFKHAGIKFCIFVTKHTDGFCNFDTKYTDYKITSNLSPYRKDVTKLFADAARKANMRFGLYYSNSDWHHPNFLNNHYEYIKYFQNQVDELISNYGKLDLLSFDSSFDPEYFNIYGIIQNIKTKQPQVIINNRLGGLAADYYTPEGNFPEFDNYRLWFGGFGYGTIWSWKPNDRIKSLDETVSFIVRCAGLGGGCILGLGPMPNGEIEPRQIDSLKRLGNWLNKYGASIYSTNGGPYKPKDGVYCTYNGSKIYLHFLEWHKTHSVIALKKKILSVKMLTPGSVTWSVQNGKWNFQLSDDSYTTNDAIVEITIEGNADDVLPY